MGIKRHENRSFWDHTSNHSSRMHKKDSGVQPSREASKEEEKTSSKTGAVAGTAKV